MERNDTRASQIRDRLGLSALDGSIIIFEGVGTTDLLVDKGTLRDAESVIAAWGAENNMPTLVYSQAEGIRAKDAPDGPRARVPSGVDIGTPYTVALDLIFDSIERDGTRTVVILSFAEGQIADDHGQGYQGDSARIVEQLAIKTTDPAWRSAGHRIVLIGKTERIDQRLSRLPGFAAEALGLPDPTERDEALALMEHSTKHPLTLESSLSRTTAGRLSGGLTVDDLSRLRYRGSIARPVTTEQILARKREALREMAGDTLVVHDIPPNLETDVAGLPQIRVAVAELQAEGDLNGRVILNGPPGVGKTWVALSMAGATQVVAIELGRIKGRYVGESQDNFRRAKTAILANLPACLVMDEIDQTVMAKRGENPGDGSSIDADLRTEFFTLLGDVGDQGGLSVIGMSNRPDLLDAASSDRFAKIPILHATHEEAAQIMAIQARREGRGLDIEGASEVLAAGGDVFSGRQLVRLLGRAGIHARRAGHERIEADDIAWALTDVVERIGPEEELMALRAVASTSFHSHYPWNAARHLGDPFAMPPKYLEPFVLSDGSVDLVAIRVRIKEMEHHAR
jgi:hypothetical protein